MSLTKCVFKIELIFSIKKNYIQKKMLKLCLPVSIYLGPLWVDNVMEKQKYKKPYFIRVLDKT